MDHRRTPGCHAAGRAGGIDRECKTESARGFRIADTITAEDRYPGTKNVFGEDSCVPGSEEIEIILRIQNHDSQLQDGE